VAATRVPIPGSWDFADGSMVTPRTRELQMALCTRARHSKPQSIYPAHLTSQ
jgi:hypothetical protein